MNLVWVLKWFWKDLFSFVLGRITAVVFGMMSGWVDHGADLYFVCKLPLIIPLKWGTQTRPRARSGSCWGIRALRSQMRVCAERWWCHWVWTSFALVSLGTLPTMQWKRRMRARESLCAGTESAAASGRFCTLPQYAWRASQERRAACPQPIGFLPWHNSIRC